MMKHFTAADILRQQGLRQARRREAFNVILENCYKKIQKCVQVTRNVFSCFCDVPEFIIGYPLYDLNECIKYCMDTLISKGFQVQYIFPRVLLISWMPANNGLLEDKNQNQSTPTTKTTTTTKAVGARKKTFVQKLPTRTKVVLDLS